METLKQNILFLLFFVYSLTTAAQETKITGKVSDLQGNALPGVSIRIQGTNIGTSSSGEGNYSIIAQQGQVLIFSFMGYQPTQQTIGRSSTINIVLQPANSDLDEVVVVGYGTSSKRQLTGNIAQISSADISQIPTPNFQSLLSAKAPGVQVMQTNGKIESAVTVRVRGVASIGAGSDPLYVLDGMPLINLNESQNGAPQNPLLTLSPNEIESIDILKDASATAIYGSRGANGVILITTKKGKTGRSTISANYSYGISNAAHKRDWLNASQYVDLLTESLINTYGEEDGRAEAESYLDEYSAGKDWRNGEVNTDWQDLALRQGYITDGDLSISGGNEKTSFFMSGAYNKTKGIVLGNDLDRINSRVNITHQFNDKFKAGANLAYSRTYIDRIANDNAFVTPLQAIALSPISPAYLDDGEPNPTTVYPNFLLQDKYGYYRTNIRRVNGKAFAEYRFLPYLKFNTDFGYDLYYQTEDSYNGRLTPFQSTNGEATATSVNTESYISSNYFTFNKDFGLDHSLELVAGMEFNDTRRRYESVTGTQFPSDDFQTISSAAQITAGSGITSQYDFLSYFLRGSYSYKNRYLLKASIRRDGSSRFGEKRRYGTFSSVSAGWVLTEEDFLKDNNTLSFLKLRGSWGQSGNAEIGNYASLGLYQGISYNQRPGISPYQAANTLLTWENVEQYDIGLDYGLFNDRISGELDYYVKKSKDLLLNVPLPGTSGFSTLTRNIGLMQNSGVEFALNTKNIVQERFTWSTVLNIAKNKNQIKDLPSGNDVINGQNILREGEPLNAFYLIEYAGADPDNGDALYYLNTKNDDGSLNKETTNDPNEAQRIIAGQPMPNWTSGLTNTMTFRDFDFSFTFQGEWGSSIYNGGGTYQSANGDYYDNQTADQLNRWQKPGDITNIPQARFGQGNGTATSTRYLQKANFVRLRNINLGYTLPSTVTQKIGLSKLRVYCAAFNLLTFTGYKGYDPEARSDSNADQVGRGIDFYSAPAARTFSFGVNLTF